MTVATLLCSSVCCTNSSSPALMRSNRLAPPTTHPVHWNSPFSRVLLFIRSPLVMGMNMTCGTEHTASSCCLLIHASEYRCRSRSHRSSRPLLCVSCPLGRGSRLARQSPVLHDHPVVSSFHMIPKSQSLASLQFRCLLLSSA